MQPNLKALVGLLALTIAVLIPAHVTRATLVQSAVSVTTTFVGSEPEIQAIDQSGLSTTYTSGVTDFETYVAGAPTHTNTGATGTTDFIKSSAGGDAGVASETITFNLGGFFFVDAIAFWSFGSPHIPPAITEVDIEASVDASFTTPISLGTFNPSVIPGASQPIQVYDSFSTTVAQYIRFTNIDNNGISSSVAFGEVAFGATAVPEARAWLMLGVVAVGAVCEFSVRKLLRRNGTPQPLVLSQL
jgi:hypothetical protein